MAKNKYFAEINGQKFTRASDRVYVATVVSKPSYALAVQGAINYTNSYDTPRTMAAWKEALSPDYEFAKYVTAAQRAEYARLIKLGTAGYAAEQLAIKLAQIEKYKAEGYYDKFANDGWCGRRDLAQKLADSCRKDGRLEVTILEAQVKA